MFEDIVAECTEAGLNVVNLEGSGEPSLNRNLAEYIAIVKKYGAKAFCFSNGMRMKDDFMREVVDAGVDFYRFSIIGYTEELYKKWMNSPFFNLALSNMKAMNEYVAKSGSDATIASYHLVLDNDNIEHEVEQYKKIVESAGVSTEIWKMHNWSGVYEIGNNERTGEVKTCGRPFSPDVVIRAGGTGGKRGGVAPCCQVLGQDEKAVLGHTSENTIEEIWNGPQYTKLRADHTSGNYPDYCRSCDFLLDDPEVLVYTNHERDLMKMHGTEFDLNDYR